MKGFKMLNQEGLCSIVPPSYMENFGLKYPGLFSWLKNKEDKNKNAWPWRNIGDYYIISFEKK